MVCANDDDDEDQAVESSLGKPDSDSAYYSYIPPHDTERLEMKESIVAAVVASMFLLGACTTPVRPTEAYGLEGAKATVNFDRRLLDDCPPLSLLSDSGDDAIVQNYKDITGKYATCRNGKKALNDQVRNILDLKDDGTATVKVTEEIKK